MTKRKRPTLATAVLALALGGVLVPVTVVQAAELGKAFEHARELALSGRREEARRVARAILEQTPGNADVEVLLARLDAWDGHYELALAALAKIAERHPEHVDARLATADVQLWRGDLSAARSACEAALRLDPGNKEAATRLDKIEARRHELEQESAAAVSGAKPRQRGTLPSTRRGYRTSLDYQADDFNQDFAAWHQLTASLETRASWGTVIGRAHYFNRFNDAAVQFDLEAYRDLTEQSYLNIAGTVATDGILPDFSTLLEIYRALPRGVEASLGLRLIRFDSLTKVYTGSLGLYRGNYWAALRPLVSSNDLGTAVSWSAKLRRYFSDEEEYATLTVTRGKELEGTAASLTLFELDTDTAVLEFRKRLTSRYIVKVLGGYEVQELPRRSNRRKLTVGLGFEYLF